MSIDGAGFLYSSSGLRKYTDVIPASEPGYASLSLAIARYFCDDVVVVDSNPDWQRLGAKIRERRNELGLTQDQAVARAQTVKVANWRKLEAGTNPQASERTLTGVARALRWTPDSIELVLAGDEPLELPPFPDSTERRLDRLEADVAELRDFTTEIASHLGVTPRVSR